MASFLRFAIGRALSQILAKPIMCIYGIRTRYLPSYYLLTFSNTPIEKNPEVSALLLSLFCCPALNSAFSCWSRLKCHTDSYVSAGLQASCVVGLLCCQICEISSRVKSLLKKVVPANTGNLVRNCFVEQRMKIYPQTMLST